jgi:ribonuclease VapC
MSFVVDSSALIAILKGEEDVEAIGLLLVSEATRYMSAGSLMECGTVIGRKLGSAGLSNMWTLLADTQVEITPVDRIQAEMGTDAYMRFGKGSGHKANLNFGDCFAYALAKTHRLPLLFKGDDFIHTDIEPALRPA